MDEIRGPKIIIEENIFIAYFSYYYFDIPDTISIKNYNYSILGCLGICIDEIQGVSKKGVLGNHSRNYGSIFKIFVIFINYSVFPIYWKKKLRSLAHS